MDKEQIKKQKDLWQTVAKGANILVKMTSGKMGMLFIGQEPDAVASLVVGDKGMTKKEEIECMKRFRDRLDKMIAKMEEDGTDMLADSSVYLHDHETGEIEKCPGFDLGIPKGKEDKTRNDQWN